MSAEAGSLVRSFFEALYAGDVGVALGCLAADAEWWLVGSLPASGRYQGKAAIETELLAPFASVWEDQPQHVAINNLIAAGEQVVIELTGSGVTAHGNRYENFYCYVVRVREGAIDRIRGYTDTGYALGVLWGPQRIRPSFD